MTIQATSGAITHSMALPISVADQLPDCPPSLNIFPSSVVGGDSAQGTVSLTGPASTGTTITLASANAAVAQVPASVIIPAGSSSASFTVTTNPVTASTTVTISATGPGGSDVFPLQVTPPTPPPPADTVAVKLAQYDTAKQLLNVEATSTSASATLTVSVTASGQTIGTLTNAGGGTYKGQFPWPVNPQQITVQSSLGGSATATVVAK